MNKFRKKQALGTLHDQQIYHHKVSKEASAWGATFSGNEHNRLKAVGWISHTCKQHRLMAERLVWVPQEKEQRVAHAAAVAAVVSATLHIPATRARGHRPLLRRPRVGHLKLFTLCAGQPAWGRGLYFGSTDHAIAETADSEEDLSNYQQEVAPGIRRASVRRSS